MKLLTVAIPCYNSESYMEHCINTLLTGGEEVEIIIVDDIGPGARSGGRSFPPGSVRMAEAFHGPFSGGGHILPGLWNVSWKLDSRHIRIFFGNGAGMGL